MNGSNKKTKEFFESRNIAFEQFQLEWNERDVNVIRTGNQNSNKMILFIHGAPGSFFDFSEYLVDRKLLSEVQMLAYDRPGFGQSGYGKSLPLIQDQVDVALHLIDNIDADSVVVVGYSYGGPIAGILAARRSEKISSLVMLAPAASPEAEPIFWFNRLINNKIASWILPTYIEMANREKFSHLKDLKNNEYQWANIDVPVHHFHCTNDWIAPFEGNLSFIKSKVNEDLLVQYVWDDDSHFLPNTQLARVRPILLQLIN